MLSAVADGEGWIFDWRFMFVVPIVVNVADFFLFSAISGWRTPASPASDEVP